ncbi:phage major capsid protein, HK97 family [Faunimonas pinastri]|uniref:Phage major capsid protein, HK97 family n=1 Tax=Faunimonas pinastri TaxID=1855383 RepID=A0A1H9MR72_9HYPH|nr:phage major capsid protein [Faunimonas pinastri]SER26128.1 phage major capsid protein, HK97 family [Faunimonas pinastri]
MPLLVEEAAKLSQEQMERGVIEEIIDTDELFALIPFMGVNGKAYVYNREDTLSEGEFLDPYEVVPEGAATFKEVMTKLRILAGDVDLDKFLITTQSDTNDQLAIQIASKSKALGRKFRRALVQGDSSVNAKEFDGIRALTPAAQTLVAGANGSAVNFGMLDELKDAVKNGADVLMMRQGTWRAVRALLRAAGGNEAATMMIKNFGQAVPCYDGKPVIINDFLPADEVQGTADATCSIYALRLNETDGFHGIYGGPNAGIQVESIGTIQNKDAVRYRVKWYVGTALKATHSVARLQGVTNV